ncbi:MAG: YibE/F family protein [Chloroflexi bacterium]|nr:YibE/F family protein [Chloroflexota bacterium]
MKLSPSRPQTAVYAAIALLLLVFVVVLPAAGVFETPSINPFDGETSEAVVVTVEETAREQTAAGVTVVSERIGVRLDGGETVTVERQVAGDDAFAIKVEPGDNVLVTAYEAGDDTVYFIADRLRTFPLWALGAVFAAAVVLIGRWRGVWSLVGLAASFLVIVRFIVPAILSGMSPLAATLIGASVIMTTTLVLAHGANRKTGAALVGTVLSLLLAVLLATFAVDVTALTGLAGDQEATLELLSGGSIDARGVLLGGIIIGALGVLDDVTATQSSAVFELRRANPLLGAGELFARGLNVGRDHIASTVNTLVLAYAGAALPLIVILSVQPEPLGLLINREQITTEIVRTLVGSIGIVAAVPITTGIAALAAGALEADDEPA